MPEPGPSKQRGKNVIRGNILVDIGLGAWASFLPLIMTLGMLGEGHYIRAVGSGIMSCVIVAVSIGLLVAGTSGLRSAVVALGGVYPASLVGVFAGDLGTAAVYFVWTLIAVGVGVLLKRAAEPQTDAGSKSG